MDIHIHLQALKKLDDSTTQNRIKKLSEMNKKSSFPVMKSGWLPKM
jgi:hypothetical protein